MQLDKRFLSYFIISILLLIITGAPLAFSQDSEPVPQLSPPVTSSLGQSTLYLPLITRPYPPLEPLEELMRTAVTTLLTNYPTFTLTQLNFNWDTLTLDLATSETNLTDNFAFQELISDVNQTITNVLGSEGVGQGLDFDYEIFINGDLLTADLPPNQQQTAWAMSGASGQRIVLSPGHGWHVNSNGSYSLDRGYHWGIVEDFINADLIQELSSLMNNSGADIRPAREVNRNVGNHPGSGYPWWQMGASEYVRSLGAPGSVWGSGYSGSNRNIVAPPEYANWINADMLVSIHNNGGGGCGTETWYDTSNGYQEQSRRLAQLIQSHVVQAIRQQYDSNWCDRGVKGSNGGYGENRRFHGPAVILELAFMDHQGNNTALKDPVFRQIAMTAVRDAILAYYGNSNPPSTPHTFLGNPSSRLYFDQNGERINLEVCADNLPGQRVYARLTRPGRVFDVVSKVANGRCTTFFNMDGPGPVFNNTLYTTKAALNTPPNDNWPVPCYSATGGRGLCDSASYNGGGSNPTTFEGNAFSHLFFDQNGERINLQVCADNLPNQTVYVRLTRPGRTFDVVSQTASSTCITFWDLDGSGPVFNNTPYTTKAALNQPPNDNWPVPCYDATNHAGLCDTATFSGGSPIIFAAPASSNLFFDQNGERINLQVCANNLAGQTVYVRLTRPGRVFDVVSQTATSTCTTFWDLDGPGPVFNNTPYTTKAALNQPPNDSWPVPCHSATGGQGLCDTATFSNGSPTIFADPASSNLFFDQNGERINLQVCASNLSGQTVYVRLTRPGRVFDIVSQTASGTCITFWDLDGSGPVLNNTPYTTKAALNQLPDDNWPVPCYTATGGQGLCDSGSYP